ncbi:MAG: FMN-binding protein [Gemmatimonadales bacterium]
MGTESGTNRKLSKNLVALGTAAVLTVYAAGFVRTRSASQRFAAEAAERRPGTATLSVSDAQPATPTGETLRPQAPARQAARAQSAPESLRVADSARAAAATPALVAPAAQPAMTTTTTPAPAPDPVPTPARDSSSSASSSPKADTAAHEPVKERAQWKDGSYTGWGTSRHGDIEAGVEIDGGRIVAAYISQCRTRYSCSWISHLPPQVVTRQSPNVDYVSGATQSTNAFYYAVVEALAKAK